MITYNNIIGRFEKFVEDHFLLKTFTHGSPSGVDLEKFEVYPALHVVYTGSTYDNTSKEYSFEVYILDLPPDKAKKIENQTQLVSNAEQVAEDILADMRNGGHIFDFGHLYTVGNASTTPLEETTSNSLAGILLTISIEVGFTLDSCNAPLDGVNPEGSAFPSASPSGLRIKEVDGSPDVVGVTTIIVSDGTLTDDGLGVVTIDTSDKGAGVYLPLIGGTLTGDLIVDTNVGIGTTPTEKLDVSGNIKASGGISSGSTITADTYFQSDDAAVVLAPTGAGTVFLRPNGIGSGAGAFSISSTGKASVNGELDMNSNKITEVLAGTTNLDAVNYQQLTDAILGVLTYKGIWDASTNSPALVSGVGTLGGYYIVSVAGTTDLDGITDWAVGDWAVFSDLPTDAWQKIDNTSILGGAGTGGKISVWTGSGVSRTLGDSVITESGGNILIGTITSTGAKVVIDHDNTKMLELKRNGNLKVRFLADSNHGEVDLYNSAGTLNVKLVASGNSYLNGGNVGIGTTSPDVKLRVEGTSNTMGVLSRMYGDGTYGAAIRYDRGTSYSWVAGIGGAGVTSGIPNSYFGFSELGNNPRLVIAHTTGNVGIGTTNPAAKLDVKTSGDGEAFTVKNSSGNNIFRVYNDDNDGAVTRFLDSDGATKVQISSEKTGATTTYFNAGNVGIGTDSPGAKLEVNGGEIRTTRENVSANYLSISTTSAGSFIENTGGTSKGLTVNNTSATSPYINFQLLSDTKMRIDESGNVGIGTSSPTQKLSVNGDVLIESVGEEASLRFRPSTTYSDVGINVMQVTGTNASPYTSKISFSNYDDANALVINGSNVGIGTSSPSANLEVSSLGGVGVSTQILVKNQDDGYGHSGGDAILESSGWGEAYLRLGSHYVSAEAGNLQFKSTANLVFKSGGSNTRMTILSAGNVGIGTASPSRQLDVEGVIRFSSNTNQAVNGYGEIYTSYSYGKGQIFIAPEAVTNPANFHPNGGVTVGAASTSPPANGLLVAGNVGIGTDSPAAKLDVNGGVRMGDDAATASATNVGTQRYRATANDSFVEMCMQTGATAYAWVIIKQNTW